jgi:hypothetical protein
MAERREATVQSGSTVGKPGSLTGRVFEYTQMIEALVPTVKVPGDWAPLMEFAAVEEFERVGTFLEVQNWQRYTEMLTQWALATDAFGTKVRRVAELPGLVYLEVEERHYRGETVNVVNSMTVFEFNVDDKVCHLDVYLQQPR